MSTDLQLQQRVLDELEFEPRVDAAHIGVVANDGVVALTGFVTSYPEKRAAEAAARRVAGVRAIAEELEVRLPDDKKDADDEIAARAVRILRWSTLVPDDRIAVTVEHGVVKLTGTVDWNYQKAEAEYEIHKLGGVVAVSNLIKVQSPRRVADVKEKIRGALKRQAVAEADRIEVDVDGGTVTLSGRVHNWQERALVENAAWSVPGVDVIRDRLTFA